jgi:hypothetical protein
MQVRLHFFDFELKRHTLAIRVLFLTTQSSYLIKKNCNEKFILRLYRRIRLPDPNVGNSVSFMCHISYRWRKVKKYRIFLPRKSVECVCNVYVWIKGRADG